MELTPEIKALWDALHKIPGGYNYVGACSDQICFPLKSGGELRFAFTDDTYPNLEVDLYDGALPPGITGYVTETGPDPKESTK